MVLELDGIYAPKSSFRDINVFDLGLNSFLLLIIVLSITKN